MKFITKRQQNCVFFYKSEASEEYLAVYYIKEKALHIYSDVQELGIYEAVSLDDNPDPHWKDRACKNCQWLTGESCLPCAVNPLAYGRGCFDYEAV
jgi:hypothetical protein